MFPPVPEISWTYSCSSRNGMGITASFFHKSAEDRISHRGLFNKIDIAAEGPVEVFCEAKTNFCLLQ